MGQDSASSLPSTARARPGPPVERAAAASPGGGASSAGGLSPSRLDESQFDAEELAEPLSDAIASLLQAAAHDLTVLRVEHATQELDEARGLDEMVSLDVAVRRACEIGPMLSERFELIEAASHRYCELAEERLRSAIEQGDQVELEALSGSTFVRSKQRKPLPIELQKRAERALRGQVELQEKAERALRDHQYKAPERVAPPVLVWVPGQ